MNAAWSDRALAPTSTSHINNYTNNTNANIGNANNSYTQRYHDTNANRTNNIHSRTLRTYNSNISNTTANNRNATDDYGSTANLSLIHI